VSTKSKRFAQELSPQITANGNLTHNPIIQTTVIDGAGFGQPGTTICRFGQNGSKLVSSPSSF
jgi:hypothetical protein